MVLEDAFRLGPQPCGVLDGCLEASNLCCAQKPEESRHGENSGTSVVKSRFLRALGYISQGTIPHSRNNLPSFPL